MNHWRHQGHCQEPQNCDCMQQLCLRSRQQHSLTTTGNRLDQADQLACKAQARVAMASLHQVLRITGVQFTHWMLRPAQLPQNLAPHPAGQPGLTAGEAACTDATP
jgi:hypothetical protein